MEDVEGDVTFGTCGHLRFSLRSECDNDFEFFGDWDTEGFVDLVEEAVSKDGDVRILYVLKAIQHPDVDKAIVYVRKEDPLNCPWTLRGSSE